MAGLYIHIPFCRSKCAYCDFYSTPHTQMTERYVDALVKEWDMRRDEVLCKDISTIYIGGGTPSMLDDSLLERLFKGISQRCDVSRMVEVTLEANPEDINARSLDFYRSLGINRISIGIQSFDDFELKTLGRNHSAAASIAALEALSASGINYSADLIYGVPFRNVDEWKVNVDRLLAFRPPHFSSYLLSFEPGTRMYAALTTGKLEEVTDETAVKMYEVLCVASEALGYNHYEVSNFAQPGMESRHNSSYWTYTPYIGLGASAHSFDGRTRRYNPANQKTYIDAVERGSTPFEVDEEDECNRLNDYIITSLRTDKGFDLQFATSRFSTGLIKRFLRNIETLPSDSIRCIDGNRFVLPKSQWLTSDAVFRELILD